MYDDVVCSSDTVSHVKRHIAHAWGYPTYTQCLTLGIHAIPDDTPLSSIPMYAERLQFTLVLDSDQALMGALGLDSLAA